MNLTTISALACLGAWLILVFLAHEGSGSIQLLYAVGMVLIARRIVVGAPKLLS